MYTLLYDELYVRLVSDPTPEKGLYPDSQGPIVMIIRQQYFLLMLEFLINMNGMFDFLFYVLYILKRSM